MKWGKIIYVIIIALVVKVNFAHAGAGCQKINPVKEIAAVRWYKDKDNSIVDEKLKREHLEAVKPLHDFMGAVSDAADMSLEKTELDLSCAIENLRSWANEGALLQEPKWSSPLAELTLSVVGLNIAALKFEQAQRPLPNDIKVWLRKITDTTINSYQTIKIRSNLYTWSAVAALANDLLMNDRHFDRYQEEVWLSSIRSIRSDGYIDGELARKGRALIYHNFMRGALVLMRRFREDQGRDSTTSETEALARLNDAVNENACVSTKIEALAGVPQEPMGRWEAAIGTYFALASTNADWRKCTKVPDKFAGASYGGRFDLTDRMITDMKKR